MKFTILIFTILLLFCSNRQENNTIDGLIIDPNIKIEVDKHMASMPEFDKSADVRQIYSNSLYAESYENDSLVFSNMDAPRILPFKSFYIRDKDTLGINGSFGFFGGTGFYIKILDKKATLYHMLSSDDFPTYAYTATDSLIMRLEVPCTDTKIILSELPDPSKNQTIYGYVEFKSNDFYALQSGSNVDKIPKRKKIRNNMKIYFKSGYFKYPE